jgi:hypothetical protein
MGLLIFNRVPRVGGLDGFLVSFESRTVAEASDIPGEIGHIEVRGYYNETTVEEGDTIGLGRSRPTVWFSRCAVAGLGGLSENHGHVAAWRGARRNGSTDDTDAFVALGSRAQRRHSSRRNYYITNVIRIESAFQRIIVRTDAARPESMSMLGLNMGASRHFKIGTQFRDESTICPFHAGPGRSVRPRAQLRDVSTGYPYGRSNPNSAPDCNAAV